MPYDAIFTLSDSALPPSGRLRLIFNHPAKDSLSIKADNVINNKLHSLNTNCKFNREEFAFNRCFVVFGEALSV